MTRGLVPFFRTMINIRINWALAAMGCQEAGHVIRQQQALAIAWQDVQNVTRKWRK